MKYITVATHSKGYLNVLIQNFEAHKETLDILGYGQKWKGFTWKYKLMRDFINDLPDDEIAVFMDGYDVLFINNKDLESKFKTFNKNIIFGVDTHKGLAKIIYNKVFHNSYINSEENININSGLYMGYVKYLKLLFNKLCYNNACNDPKMDDQKLIIKLSKTDFFRENVGIDYEQKIFFNMSPNHLFTNKTNFKLTNNKVIINNNEPNFIHGPSNVNMDFIIDAYGFSNNNKSRGINYVLNAIKTYYVYFIPELIIFFLIIFFIILIYIRKK